ncbi:MAG: ferrous iron transport protein B [Gemmatimonadetes bacterium]|nr:ferrous iron transport protein B [Gemmatimonadota bacterium]NIU77592.1 ferrous iron transport protein B [Gammaproteobacteria bacterium]NIQ57426.1 ferrous iron transport protein B [Gemmatimonadota bacterium]NIW37412.1 ferrous iron transport protein B [Gemmatimonadota bacterium]NIX46777.1 ferrous iron transport protein B [Gemmatimonadota bacterium]
MPTITRARAEGAAQHRRESLVRLGLTPDRWDYLVALAGNPNTGKTTVFNGLTGLRQHTGNWPGKTVARAEGAFAHRGKRVKVVDLPGTYSLQAGSTDEEVARDFIVFGRPDVTVVVVDATRLERNLNLVLQVLEITDRVVVCLNLMDEAKRHGIAVDAGRLERQLGVPVVATVARRGDGMDELLAAVEAVATGERPTTPFRLESHAPEVEEAAAELVPAIERAYPGVANARWVALRLLNGDQAVEQAVRDGELGLLGSGGQGNGSPPDEAAIADLLETASRLRWDLRPDFHDALMERLYAAAQEIAEQAQERGLKAVGYRLDRKLDALLTSRWLGFPLMLLILAVVFWITIEGANVPSQMLATLLIDNGHAWLTGAAASLGMPWWLSGFLFDGVYLATAWVVSVMLPPMAIFFPLFTLLEDFGYLPRVAFNLDGMFRRVGAHGKQALTMAMGFGCNAAGVVATRVIDSPRERLIAIITNNFSLCNGRWPTQILIATIFIGALAPAHLAGLVSAAAVVGIAVLGILFMFLASWLLSSTVLRGEATTFSLELPPYRPPRVLQTLYTSIIDRTLIVLWRAVVFAVPAGAVIWLSANISFGGASIAEHLISLLNPVGLLVGMNGVILLAYVVAIPANEIVIPTILMLTVMTTGLALGEGAGVMFELDSTMAMADVLRAGGWTLLTGVNLMLFSLLHNPCSTTIYTIYKETGSAKWTTVAALLPLAMGFVVTFLVAQAWRLVA